METTTKTIRLTKTSWKLLNDAKEHPRETHSDVIKRILDKVLKTKKRGKKQ